MVDLNKNEAKMKEAWKDVTNDNSSTNWALFGYEGQTNILTLVGKGEDGIDEMIEDLNPSKIMYGFLRVEDPKTSLPKYVILNWQGETAPGGRKGVCAMHLRDIERFLSGHHLTLNVRNEDEIDMETITKKVSEITGSSYNFKEKPQGMEYSPAPVGTCHKKINPERELPNMETREKFWSKDQDEEKNRVLEERDRRAQETKNAEEERKKREEVESEARDNLIKDKERKVWEQRKQEKYSEEERVKIDMSRWEKQQVDDAAESKERNLRSERMRQDRAKEAQELIRQRTSDVKKVFLRNSSQGQMNVVAKSNLPVVSAPSTGVVRSPLQPSPFKLDHQPVPAQPNHQPASIQPDHRPAPIQADHQPASVQPLNIDPHSLELEPNKLRNESLPNGVEDKDENDHQLAPPIGFEEECDKSTDYKLGSNELHHALPVNMEKDKDASLESYGVCAVSLYDYQASDETEISFDPGQIITHIDQIDPGWWQGLGPDGSYGLFPANYVEIIDSSELQIQA